LATLLDKAIVLVTNHLLFGNSRDIAPRPLGVKGILQGQEFVVATLNLDRTLRISTSHGVFDDCSDLEAGLVIHFDWVGNVELRLKVLLLVLLLHGLELHVESADFGDQLLLYLLGGLVNLLVSGVVRTQGHAVLGLVIVRGWCGGGRCLLRDSVH